MNKKSLIILDLETTGLSPYRHKITEIAAVKLFDGDVVDEFKTLINPEEPIPSFITRLTGITDEMVSNAPLIEAVLDDLKDFIGDGVIVAHNASFDYKFLEHNFYKHKKYNLVNDRLCTVKLANRIHSDLPSKKLSALCEFYDVVNESAHRAMGDVLATKEVFFWHA